MALEIGIVGLPNVGKSTLFNALTEAGVLAANYPFATIEPNTGVVPIPDPRVNRLGTLFGSKKSTAATVTFVDIAGLVKGASKGEGLGNQFLAHIRDVDAICHVVRAFEASSVVHVDEELNSESDIETVETELALADLQTIEKRLSRLEKEASTDPSLRKLLELLQALAAQVSEARLISRSKELMARRTEFADLHLLTAKPIFYVFNCDDTVLADEVRRTELQNLVAPSDAVFLDAEIEAELLGLGHEEVVEFLEEIGQDERGLDAVVHAAYRTLGLQSFLTGGEKEARAWTIESGTTAYEAAGEIHTDFQRGFIAAEIIDFDILEQAGTWAAARAKGLIRTEGRDYVMKPNDVVQFRFNV